MYLSRLSLNPRIRDAQRDLASPYDLHRTLARVFPGDRAGDEGPNDSRSMNHGLLFRTEPEALGGPAVLVQSLTEPDWSALPDGYARVDGPKSVRLDLEVGQRLRFRLVANPTVKKRVEGKKNGARIPLVHDRAPEGHSEVSMGYLDWLDRKAETGGFVVQDVVDAPFTVSGGRAKPGLSLFGVRFDGTLRVNTPGILAEVVRRGVGPAKGFGFGLLSVAPVR